MSMLDLFRRQRAMLVAVIAFLLAWPSMDAHAGTVLSYDTSGLATQARPRVPASVFHDWAAAQKQAQGMVDAWGRAEPTTIAWTRLQLASYIKHKMMPTRGARGLALVHVAMYDAMVLADQRQQPRSLAVSAAAAHVLSYLFPAEEGAFQRIAFAAAASLSRTTPQALPDKALSALQLGEWVGRTVVAHAETDGAQRGWNGVRLQWYGEGRYYGPGAWEPVAPYFYYPPDEPFAPQWRPWVLTWAGQFRPTPPAFGSRRYMRDLQEVVDIDRNRTPSQLAIAKFWVDGHGSYTPAGHWNDIAIERVLANQLDEATTARLFMRLNVAMADGFIACWDVKYHYWTMRPITAAKHLLGVNFMPPILTPPFPSYVSGHATFSGAAARVLAAHLPREAAKLDNMAEEAAHSRLLGAIHFRHDNQDGLELGRKIADLVLEKL